MSDTPEKPAEDARSAEDEKPAEGEKSGANAETSEDAAAEASPEPSPGPIPQDLLDILVCPLGKKPLELEESELVCTHCGARYPIVDGIPNMLVDEATLPEGVGSVEELACYALEVEALARLEAESEGEVIEEEPPGEGE